MKRTLLDKFVGFFSPEAESKRIRAKAQTELQMRAYDIAKSFPNSDWTSATKSSANAETKAAIGPGREKARALTQNNPYGLRAVNVIVTETVGSGIVANIKGKDETQTKILQDLWKLWAESTLCDFERQQNFYGLQQAVMRSTVESGEGLGLFRMSPIGPTPVATDKIVLKGEVPSIRLIESDFINTKKDEGKIIQGVEVDANGLRTKYYLFKTHPGNDRDSSEEMITVPASELVHVYKKERPGQLRGVTWAHPVVEKMKDFDDYQHATLIRQKIAACFGGFITTTGSDSLADPADLKAKREAELAMQPNTWRYLSPGEEVTMANPPTVNGYADFNRETLRAIAAGFGISFEAFTGDYSQSNYSSSRMGHLQMRKNVEAWRWNMLIPMFCEPTFQRFLVWAKTLGAVGDKDLPLIKCKWVTPAYSMVDPSKEILSLQREVRSGFKSWGDAVIEQGNDPEETLNEIAVWNKKFDDQKVTLDIDPRRMSQIGFSQAGDALSKLSPDATYLEPEPDLSSEGEQPSEDTNQEDATPEPDTRSGKRVVNKRRKSKR